MEFNGDFDGNKYILKNDKKWDVECLRMNNLMDRVDSGK